MLTIPTRAELLALPLPTLAFMASEAAWKSTARQSQIAPPGDWSTWLAMAGRGWGKSRVGNEWAREKSWLMPGSIGHVVAPTSGDLIGTMFEGPAGLTKVIPDHLIANYTKSPYPVLKLHNGTTIRGFAADTPDRLRGPQCHWVLCDELAAWTYLGEAWANIVFSTRLPFIDAQGNAVPIQRVITTTPRPLEFLRDMEIKARDPKNKIVITRGSTYENKANLDDEFFRSIADYEGTPIGRQEIHGEILDPEERGIIKRSWLRIWPMDRGEPELIYICYSLDTAFTEATQHRHPDSTEAVDRARKTTDPTACTVWGVFLHTDPKTKVRRYSLIMLDCWSDYLGFPDLLARVRKESQRRYGPMRAPLIVPQYGPKVAWEEGKAVDVILIEDKASGPSLRQMLEREGLSCHPYNPGRADKLARLHAVSHIAHEGRIFLPESAVRAGMPRDWIDPWMAQVCVYSGERTTKHDDFVDSTTQAWRFLADKFMTRGVRQKDDMEGVYATPEVVRENPYAV